MKLVDTRTNEIYVNLEEGADPFFASSVLEREMMLYGIEILPPFAKDFSGKKFIFPEDKDFPRAFHDVYYLSQMNRNIFQWT